MSQKTLIKNGLVISGGKQQYADVLIEHETITRIDSSISDADATEMNAEGKWVLPGMIDTHVHFRDPGLTHKGDADTESQAAIAGGVTSICDMPNTIPQTTTIEAVKDKQQLFAEKCLCNFGIYIGATKTNLDELKKAGEDTTTPAIKIFMAESTGEMTLADDEYLEPIFRETSLLIALHAEDEGRRLARLKAFQDGTLADTSGKTADNPMIHAIIRDNKTAEDGTKHAVALAQKFNHRIHILHVSTHEEVEVLKALGNSPLVTAETCPHYLLFNRNDIETHKGYRIMNPALKGVDDNEALWQALADGTISHYATDHAPHLREEKDLPYGKLPAGLPGVQFALPILLNAVAEGKLTIERVVELYAENPARHYNIAKRGTLQEGNYADITIVNQHTSWNITNDMVLSKCGWTPYEGMKIHGRVETTMVNGAVVYEGGMVKGDIKGRCLEFERGM